MPEYQTCATCKYMGGVYHDTGCRQDHSCGKTAERRRDTMKPTGDFAQDFMDNFRTFFDAGYRQRACKYYEEGAPSDADAAMLLRFDDKGLASFAFFGPENAEASRHPKKYYEQDWYRKDKDGYRSYKLTDLGRITRETLVKAIATQEPA
jgi:hypothetical protein